MPGDRVTRFPYHVGMAGGEVNREEWAAVIRELLAIHTRGKKAPFARLVGVDVSTIDNWLAGSVRVSEASVRQVAEACSLPLIELKLRVGIYDETDLPPARRSEIIDEEQRRVLELDDIDVETKAAILQQLDEMRTADEHLLEEQRDRDRLRRRRELDYLISQARRQA